MVCLILTTPWQEHTVILSPSHKKAGQIEIERGWESEVRHQNVSEIRSVWNLVRVDYNHTQTQMWKLQALNVTEKIVTIGMVKSMYKIERAKVSDRWTVEIYWKSVMLNAHYERYEEDEIIMKKYTGTYMLKLEKNVVSLPYHLESLGALGRTIDNKLKKDFVFIFINIQHTATSYHGLRKANIPKQMKIWLIMKNES